MSWLEPIGVRMAPGNFGPMKGAAAHARIAGSCGDTMEFWLRMDGPRIQHASYTTDGCESSVAAGAVVAHLCQGRTLEEVRRIRPLEILETLGVADSEAGQEVHHCAELALETLVAALHGYARSLSPRETCAGDCDATDCAGCPEECAEHRAPQSGRTSADAPAPSGAAGVRKRFLVLSGKGGVGKSTVAVNLAMGLAAEGLATGLLDVDIHGPSVPKLLGLEGETIQAEGRSLMPVEVGPLKVMSMGFALEADQAAIWRGPMKAGVIEQFVRMTRWDDLDALVVDCPPGTGDEVLAIAQTLGRVDGVVVVTTPQDLAVLDARKAITFCRKLELPVVGIVENMSGFACPGCGRVTPVFRTGGGKALAEELGLPFLGTIPLDAAVGEGGDSGTPRLFAGGSSSAAQAFAPILGAFLARAGADQ